MTIFGGGRDLQVFAYYPYGDSLDDNGHGLVWIGCENVSHTLLIISIFVNEWGYDGL